jgi:hypothetical protein
VARNQAGLAAPPTSRFHHTAAPDIPNAQDSRQDRSSAESPYAPGPLKAITHANPQIVRYVAVNSASLERRRTSSIRGPVQPALPHCYLPTAAGPVHERVPAISFSAVCVMPMLRARLSATSDPLMTSTSTAKLTRVMYCNGMRPESNDRSAANWRDEFNHAISLKESSVGGHPRVLHSPIRPKVQVPAYYFQSNIPTHWSNSSQYHPPVR